MLVLPVWVNIRVSDDLGTTIVLHLFLLSLSFSLNCSRASKEFWVGRVRGGILCRCVFLGFFPFNLNYAFELHRTGSVTWYTHRDKQQSSVQQLSSQPWRLGWVGS